MKIGIVGLGGMANVHFHNYKQILQAEVVAAVGATEQDALRGKEWGVPVYKSIAEMIEATQPDLVDVCSPTFLHKEHVTASLKFGKHTLVEKPIALSAGDAHVLYDLARDNGCRLYVGQVLRFSKETKVLRDLIQSREYGRPLDAVFERLSAAPRWVQGGWLFDQAKSGLIPYDLHIHDLDLIVTLFGRPDTASFTSCRGADKDYPEQYRFSYGYDSMNVSAEAAWFNADIPFFARWRVYFENAVVIFDGQTITAYQFDYEPRIFDTKETVLISTGINIPPTGMFIAELTHFLECAAENKPSEIVPESEILAVMEVLEDMLS